MFRIILFFVLIVTGITCIEFPVIWFADGKGFPTIYSTVTVMIGAFTAAGVVLLLILRHNFLRAKKERELVDSIGEKE